MSSPDSERRQFLKLVGLAGASAALGAVPLALAATTKPAKPATEPPKQPERAAAPPAPGAPPSPPPEVVEEARALAQILEHRYGKHLDAAQLAAVTRELESRLQGGRALRAAKLANADEPDTIFRA